MIADPRSDRAERGKSDTSTLGLLVGGRRPCGILKMRPGQRIRIRAYVVYKAILEIVDMPFRSRPFAIRNLESSRMSESALRLARFPRLKADYPRLALLCFEYRASRSRTFRCRYMTFGSVEVVERVDRTSGRTCCPILVIPHDIANTSPDRLLHLRSGSPWMGLSD